MVSLGVCVFQVLCCFLFCLPIVSAVSQERRARAVVLLLLTAVLCVKGIQIMQLLLL